MVSGRREQKRGNTDGPVPSDARGVSYSDGALGPEARVSRNSAKARRTIMPRFALQPGLPLKPVDIPVQLRQAGQQEYGG